MSRSQALTRAGRATIWLAPAIILSGFALAEAIYLVGMAPPAAFGVDLNGYLGHAARWRDGGSFYLPWQLAGPYEILSIHDGQPVPAQANPVLYPPLILPLLVPFLYLPPTIWWAIPLAVVAYTIWRHKPNPLGLAVIAALATVPRSLELWLSGNPAIWAMAAVAAGTLWRWPYALVFLKPSLFPFALLGASDRRWWVACVAMAFVSAPLLSEWQDWFQIMTNARGSLLYSIAEVPALCIPIAAWLGRTTRDRSGPALDPPTPG